MDDIKQVVLACFIRGPVTAEEYKTLPYEKWKDRKLSPVSIDLKYDRRAPDSIMIIGY